MLAILNSLKAHNLPIFQLILMILVSKFMVQRALSDKTYLLLGLLSPLIFVGTVIAVSRVSNLMSGFLQVLLSGWAHSFTSCQLLVKDEHRVLVK